jgi:adenylyl-sulfate kinase
MMTVWLTGRPCSGKTTLGVAVRDRLKQGGWNVELLDGDLIRRNLWPELGFSKENRADNVRRFGYLAEMLARHGVIPIVCAVSPYREERDRIRRDSTAFIEVYANAPLEICEERDIKGMYKKARAGQLPDFTGVADPYEPPLNPEVECFTNLESVEQSTSKIVCAVYDSWHRRKKRK